ncbi:WD40/YVTN/BNR-like repeat-containing protein [Cystobacter fuscus]
MALVLGLCVGMAAACYPRGCEGCVNAQGVCLRGVQDSACGSFGAACVACESGSTCQQGTCAPEGDPGLPDAGPGVDAGVDDAGTGDGGSSIGFQLVPSTTTATLRDVAAVTPLQAYAVGLRGTVLQWNGGQWSAAGAPTSLDLHAVTLAEGGGWAVGEGGTLLSLKDGTWSLYGTSPTAAQLTGVSSTSARSAMAVGQEGAQRYTLVWDGAQWTKFATGAPDSNSTVSDVFMLADGTAFAAQDSMIMRWKGTDWEQLTLPTTTALQSVWAPSANEAFGVGSSGVLMRWQSTSGRTLEQRPPYPFFHGVWGSSSRDIWAVGAGGVIVHWDGDRWTDVASPTTKDLYGVSGTGPNDVWIVGAGGTILHGP